MQYDWTGWNELASRWEKLAAALGRRGITSKPQQALSWLSIFPSFHVRRNRQRASCGERARLLSDAGEAARADVVKASTQVAFLRQSLTSAELAATLANQDLAAF